MYGQKLIFSNLLMSQVVVNGPVPMVEAKGRDFEDTMLLLEIIKENKQQEMRQQRVRTWV